MAQIWSGGAIVLGALVVLAAGPVAGAAARPAVPPRPPAVVPRPDHVVIVMEENHSYNEIIGAAAAPYMNTLATGGALMTNSSGVEHPSQPNYLDLFSGANQGVTDDSCPHTFATANLGAALITAGFSFTGYSEDLPAAGSTICSSGYYWRKHSPWINFSNLATTVNQPFTSFPSDYSTLPTLSFVIPNQLHDMHDGTIAQADTWLQQQISGYAQWASTHNSLLIVQWDEDDYSSTNHIPTIFYGAMVMPGQYSETINHYNVLRTLEDMYGLPYVGASSSATAITDIWVAGTATATATTTDTPTVTDTPTMTDTPTVTRTPTTIPTGFPTVTPTATATGTAVPCNPTFSDVQPADYFYAPVQYLACGGVISGYGDGMFRPYNQTTRGQMSKIVVLADSLPITTPAGGDYTFADNMPGSTFFDYVETAVADGIVGGYACGGTNPQTGAAEPCDDTSRPYYRVGNNITRGQLAKIVVIAAVQTRGWTVYNPSVATFGDVRVGSTFAPFVETAVCHGVVNGYSDGTFRPAANATRGQISKIVYNAVTGSTVCSGGY